MTRALLGVMWGLAICSLAACGDEDATGTDASTARDTGTAAPSDGGGDVDTGSSPSDASMPPVDTGSPTGDAGGDELFVACMRRIESATACSTACDEAAQVALDGPCADESAAIQGHPEIRTFAGCVSGCPEARVCGTETLADCACATACVRERSESFQDAFVAQARCITAEVEGICF